MPSMWPLSSSCYVHDSGYTCFVHCVCFISLKQSSLLSWPSLCLVSRCFVCSAWRIFNVLGIYLGFWFLRFRIDYSPHRVQPHYKSLSFVLFPSPPTLWHEHEQQPGPLHQTQSFLSSPHWWTEGTKSFKAWANTKSWLDSHDRSCTFDQRRRKSWLFWI